MKVRELIEKLQQMDDYLEVVVTEPEWHGDTSPLSHKVFDVALRSCESPKPVKSPLVRSGDVHFVSILADGFESQDEEE